MSNHETLEAGVLGGVALLFVLAIFCISIDPDWYSGDASAPAAVDAGAE